MKVEYIARKVTLTPKVRGIAEKKLAKVEKYFNDIIDLRLEMSQERHLYVADILLKGKDFSLKSTSSSKDLTTAIQDAIDKLEMQARKAKTRLKDHKRHGGDVREESSRAEEDLEPASTDGDSPQIVETSAIPVKPMSVDEAVMQLEESEELFIVFNNSSTEQVNVLYRRGDKNLGLITPEA